jgi:hypothetical protein
LFLVCKNGRVIIGDNVYTETSDQQAAFRWAIYKVGEIGGR